MFYILWINFFDHFKNVYTNYPIVSVHCNDLLSILYFLNLIFENRSYNYNINVSNIFSNCNIFVKKTKINNSVIND